MTDTPQARVPFKRLWTSSAPMRLKNIREIAGDCASIRDSLARHTNTTGRERHRCDPRSRGGGGNFRPRGSSARLRPVRIDILLVLPQCRAWRLAFRQHRWRSISHAKGCSTSFLRPTVPSILLMGARHASRYSSRLAPPSACPHRSHKTPAEAVGLNDRGEHRVTVGQRRAGR